MALKADQPYAETTRFAHNGPCKLRFDVVGVGEPVLLIMGLGASRAYWRWQVDSLQTRFRLLTFDNRGCGESSCPRDSWTMAEMADDVIAVMDAAGIARAHVVGISMGGMIAQHVALRYPERVARLVLMATHAGSWYYPPTPHALKTLIFPGKRPLREIVGDQVALMFPQSTLAADPTLASELEALFIRHAPRRRGMLAQALAVAGHDTRAELGRIFHDTLVITGDDDQVIPPENATLLASALPHSRLVTITSTGHGLFIDQAARINALLCEFLDAW